MTNQGRASANPPRAGLRPALLAIVGLLAAGLLAPRSVPAQTIGPNPAPPAAGSSPSSHHVQSELVFDGQGSFGNYKIFAQGEHSKLFSAGVEYDRHTWGRFAGSNVYYVGEFLPFVMLDEPLYLNYYGVPNGPGKKKQDMQLVPGIGIMPLGIRFIWRDGARLEPYFMIKGGILVFSQKAESPNGSYEQVTLRSEIGTEIRFTRKTGLRLGMGDSHFSNLFVVPSNPGLDVMSYMFGITHYFGARASP